MINDDTIKEYLKKLTKREMVVLLTTLIENGIESEDLSFDDNNWMYCRHSGEYYVDPKCDMGD